MPSAAGAQSARTNNPALTIIALRLLVFLALGAASGFAASMIPLESHWLWVAGAFLPLGPILAMLFGVWRRWPEIHPNWALETVSIVLLALSVPWAIAGFWLGVLIASGPFHAGMNAAVYSGVCVGAAFSVLLVFIAVGFVAGSWSARVACKLVAAAAITLFVMHFCADRGEHIFFPLSMGLMSAVMGWYLLRPGTMKNASLS